MRPLADLNNLAKSRQIDSDIERFLANGGEIKKFTNNVLLEKAVNTGGCCQHFQSRIRYGQKAKAVLCGNLGQDFRFGL